MIPGTNMTAWCFSRPLAFASRPTFVRQISASRERSITQREAQYIYLKVPVCQPLPRRIKDICQIDGFGEFRDADEFAECRERGEIDVHVMEA
jgi:hypothetical protein